MEAQGRFAELLSTHSFGKAFFCNSGAEAVEAAIKLARLHTPEGKHRIITFENGFHGRTYGAVTATAQPKYHEGIGPMLAGFRYAPHNDLDAVKALVDEETAAILIEPVQGEGGVNLPKPGLLEGLRKLADEHGCLLIFDEVQTGMGRTGQWFAYKHFGVQPDIMTMAKGLAGGVACGGIMATEEVSKSLRPGVHASTFGGNPLAMAAGIATATMIENQNLLENCRKMSERFKSHLEPLAKELPIIDELRILGMMIGIELTLPATPAVAKCMEKGLLINATHDTVVRLLPPINITAEEVDAGCEILAEVLRDMADEE
jgi:acetylornithine/succinyldiaminopimelate/putrescine aminotransferase